MIIGRKNVMEFIKQLNKKLVGISDCQQIENGR